MTKNKKYNIILVKGVNILIIFPNKISNNCTIGITATSSGTEDARSLNRLTHAIQNMKNAGFNIIETDNVRKCDKLASSSGKTRSEEFLSLWNNQEVEYIIAKSGGEFLMEMIPYLHKEKLQLGNPKWVQGFSDTSLLLYYLTTNYNIATVEASNFTEYSARVWHDSMKNNLNILKNASTFSQENFEKYEAYPISWEEGKELEPYNLTETVIYKSLDDEPCVSMEGRLIGGTIDTIKTIIGTEYDNTINFCKQFKEGILWHLENCELNVPDLYRALWQMKEAKWFENATGIIIGRTMSNSSVGDFTYEDALENIFRDLKIPVIYGVDFGHLAPRWTLINGSFAKFKYENGKGKIQQEL